MENEIIIVTGGAGFIGSNLVKALNERGEKNIIIVDNFKNIDKYRNLNALDFLDIIQKEDFLDIIHNFKKIKAIFHLGACSSTTEKDGIYLLKNNYEYSKIICKYAQKNNVPFIYASSASVYGNGKNGFQVDEICEDPINGYASSKYLMDNFTRLIFKSKKQTAPIVGLRYFNVFGYQENHKGDMASVPFKFFNQINCGEKIQIFENSDKTLRDFIFIEDVIKVTLFLYDKKISGIFNCGTGKSRTFQDMANIFKSNFSKANLEFIPFPKHLEGRYQFFTQADIKELKSAGYSNDFLSLEKGLDKYFKVLNNSNGYLEKNKKYFI